jgi:hypothetical protein
LTLEMLNDNLKEFIDLNYTTMIELDEEKDAES